MSDINESKEKKGGSVTDRVKSVLGLVKRVPTETQSSTSGRLASWEKRRRSLIIKLGLAGALLLLYIAWALPVALLGALACACVFALVVLTEAIYAYVNGGGRKESARVPIYLYHLSKSSLGVPFQTTLVLAAVVSALFCYQWAVDSCYRKVADAYSKVNVLRDMVRKMPLIEWSEREAGEKIDFKSGAGVDGADMAKACFIEILREMKLVDPEEFLKTSRSPDGRLDYSTFQNQDGIRWLADHLFDDQNKSEERFLPVDNKLNNATLRMILEIAMKLKRDEYNKEHPKYFEDAVVILSGVLSGEPGAYDAYRNGFFKSDEKNQDSFAGKDYAEINAKLFENLRQSNFGERFSIRSGFWNSLKTWFLPGEVPDDKEVLNLIFLQEQAIAHNDHVKSDVRFLDDDYDATSNDGTLNRADVLFIQQFCLEALSKTHENEDVKAAKRVLSVFLGPEQFFMLIVFFICVFTMLNRLFLYLLNGFRFRHLALKREGGASRAQILAGPLPRPQERAPIIQAMRDQLYSFVDYVYPAALEVYDRYTDDQAQERNAALSEYLDYVVGYCNAIEQRSRWVVNWAAVTLPAVGFIGTVRGMLLALGNADSIVRATSSAAQAAAITNVASSLSLAFTTTLVALFLGLIITLLNFWQIKQEKNYLSELDRALRLHFNLWNTTRSDDSSVAAPETARQDS